MKIPRLLDDRLKLRHLVLVDALSRVRCRGDDLQREVVEDSRALRRLGPVATVGEERRGGGDHLAVHTVRVLASQP